MLLSRQTGLIWVLCALGCMAQEAAVVPKRRQYATSACSGRTTGHFFTKNFECVAPGNFMGSTWVKASCTEVDGNVTFEHFESADCAGNASSVDVYPSGCHLCSDPGYSCYGGGLKSVSIRCLSSAVAKAATLKGAVTVLLAGFVLAA
mmetsp:Transcript_63207/g.100348  ORF Transcript_63207/g.100348 Transcript_63207/m.100348 type:complete len:148 (-) Transcript_63207:32-475(-)